MRLRLPRCLLHIIFRSSYYLIPCHFFFFILYYDKTNSDDQQFYQYQQKNNYILPHIIKHVKTTTYVDGNLCSGSGTTNVAGLNQLIISRPYMVPPPFLYVTLNWLCLSKLLCLCTVPLINILTIS